MSPKVNHELHFLFIPLFSPSHIIPLTDFAKLLAHHDGITVSIVTTPQNFIRYKSINDYSKSHNLKIHLVSMDFPSQESGLPPGCESLDSLASLEFFRNFFQACSMLQSPLENLILGMEQKPNCVVSTSALPWTQELADRFNIPRYVFETVSCFTISCAQLISELQDIGVSSDSESFLVPHIPHRIAFTRAQLPEFKNSGSEDVINYMKQVLKRSRGTIVNTFQELEPWYVEECKRQRNKIWCIGPVSSCNKELYEKTGRGSKPSIDEHHCISWLNSMKPKSVIYACFGSLCHLTFPQIKELGLGLESSNSPFIWAIRKQDCSEQVENWLAIYEQRVGDDKCLIIRGWAPQVLILSHPSIGGFFTHCGWNSTLEGICVGVPMITWPMFAEQFYNEKFIVDVLKIGVRIGVEVSMDYYYEKSDEAMVTCGQVTSSIEQAMDSESDEVKMIRKRAEELAVIARKALDEGGSSYNDVLMLIQDVLQQM